MEVGVQTGIKKAPNVLGGVLWLAPTLTKKS